MHVPSEDLMATVMRILSYFKGCSGKRIELQEVWAYGSEGIC